jgi:hypothetical protein
VLVGVEVNYSEKQFEETVNKLEGEDNCCVSRLDHRVLNDLSLSLVGFKRLKK